MKDQILKIAKVKNEKEFYKKYPTEEAFMAKHGKALKKAAMGKAMVYDQLNDLTSWDNPSMAQNGESIIPSYQSPGMPNMAGLNAKLSDSGFQQQAISNVANSAPAASAPAFNAGAAGMAGLQGIGKIIGGIEAIGAQRKAQKKAQQANQLSSLAVQASQPTAKIQHKYVRPEDSLVQPGQMGNPYGTGTNYLSAQDGAMIGGNPTQIQNTYAPTGDLYRDLGYEPLQESVYKQYRRGGNMPKAEFGEYFQDSGEAQIGSAVGGAIAQGFGLPPVVGELVGKVGGNLAGGIKNARKLQEQKSQTELNQSQLGFQQNLKNGPLGASLEDGGKVGDEYKWMSHTWQPQVIAKFGEYDVKDLLKPPHDADMLRSGGHLAQVPYTPPSAEALYTGRPDMPHAQYGVQMAMGGELEVGDGGHLETMSYNPNLPGGEIGMFKGASHDNGGIKTKYGENEVEVEGGEPAVKLKDGGQEDNLVVFGNIKINKEIANLMGDPKAKGMKFKTYIADVAKNDAKQLKNLDKGLEIVNNATDNSARDHLAMNTGQALVDGATAWQKINAEKIKQAGLVQDSIHQVANRFGVKSDKLAEGKFEKETDPSMMGKNGKKMKKAQNGEEIDPITLEAMRRGIKSSAGLPGSDEPGTGPEVVVTSNRHKRRDLPMDIIPYEGAGTPLYNIAPEMFTGQMPDVTMKKGKGKGINWPHLKMPNINWQKAGDVGEALLSNAAPWLRPSNANEDLPPDQLYPEYFALANNQVEPVQAQLYHPMLDTPYNISLNDQVNAIDSQARAAIRAAGQNPASQALIMTQALEAKNKVLGEQSRINQANQMGVYAKNRELLNDAQLKNLQILDQQYVRQAQAKSNTKEQAQMALNSIAAKTAQQRATNRKLAVLENMYNFRFTPSGRAVNANLPASWNLAGNMNQAGSSKTDAYGNQMYPIYNPKTGKIKGYSVAESSGPSAGELDDALGKNGKKIKARNSSIVKALKNL
jgi:hypothetical protein